MKMNLRNFSLALAVASSGVFAFGTNHLAADTLVVEKSHAKVFRVSRPAGTVIVGDPDIVKATMQDLKTLVLTGKAYGSTNVIVLDADGEPMIDELVIVQSNQKSTVNVFTQTQVTSIACGKVCQPVTTTSSTTE